ncbi:MULTISPECIES: endonuclease III [Prochlorococcus]|uniref:endonuclease III n=1 Tax=Prochlorococcus TaxID=1218 RepID=UPI0007B3ED2A|nr:endonuclease III [Prochlorococcus marinus]NMO84183.1 endonuclease III [Prochlorococcus sp. P1344]NMP05929.1 endonuclease III [Prochlorococcus sp. P1361]NMP12265.1 endonuclease III [Prochlorococcus sp.P1363]KZR67144.1 Endonuclease III [Prochlorococcus marinus str. MIT 1312]KZR82805.1 Endonuclease III [Prochlorococcus marinus str. MIT 1327]
MKKHDRALTIMRRLNEYYPHPPIPLIHSDDFSLLVAVVLSAQCTDKKVNEVTPALFKSAPTPEEMFQLGESKILGFIRQLGLANQKAKNIHKLSEIIVDRFESCVPQNFIDLESLPGVGHKTASVVMAQAFGVPTFPVDTHIHRLAQRWGLSNGRSVIQTEKDLKSIFPKTAWNKLHLQFIYYGREHCTARGCDGTTCDLCQELYPKRRRPVIWNKP